MTAPTLRAFVPPCLRALLPVLLLAGCGTCVTVTGTSGAVWDAVERSALGELRVVSDTAPPALRRDTAAGTLTTTVAHGDTSDEVSVRITIKPAWTEETVDHDVCIFVQQMTAERDDVAMRTRRRPDIERNIADGALAIVGPAPGE